MTNKISIDVGLTAPDTSAIEQRLNQLGQKIAQANRVQFNPVSKAGLADLAAMETRFKEMVKVQASLRQRIHATGQQNTPFANLDWERMHPNASSRGRSMMNAYRHVVGDRFGPMPASPPGPPAPPGGRPPGTGPSPSPAPGPNQPTWSGTGMNVVQAGLKATGPVGGVASSALNAGMTGGMGAGIMGLVGGIAALGVGKLIGAVTDKIEAAEQNAVSLDSLKRIIGDVGVNFNTLKSAVQGSAENLKITYAEAGKLSTQFAKLSNLSGDQLKSIPAELNTGVGLSRSFGLDPSQGVGVLGQMRGLGVTSNTQESRRFALLIGETIGKSGAFSKADEVMESMANYATSQTRSGMSAANVAGYAGTFSGMMGSGIPGMDAAGAASLLGRINSAISSGGMKGEASQYFTGGIGASQGLNPYQTRALRENGAFGTMDQTFGAGSVYQKYTGKSGPGGGDTMLSMTLDKLKSQYRPGSMELAEATANHLGIGVNQAMALHNIKPNEMGEMQGYAGDLTKMTGGGIGNLSKALYGSAGERQALSADFLGRRGPGAISAEDRKKLEDAKGGSDDDLKRALASMAAKYDQERTTGSDIRDSKNTLDNIKTSLAERLIPLTQGIRDAVMFTAGDQGKLSPLDIQKRILKSESEERARNTVAGLDGEVPGFIKTSEAAKKAHEDQWEKVRNGASTMTPEVLATEMKKLALLADERTKAQERMRDDIAKLQERKAAALKAEAELLEKSVADLKKSYAASISSPATDLPGPGNGFMGAGSTGRRSGGGYDPLNNATAVGKTASNFGDVTDPAVRRNRKTFLDALGSVEGAGYDTVVGGGKFDDFSKHPNRVGMVTGDGKSTAAGRYQMINGTWESMAGKLGLTDFSPKSQDEAAIELIRQKGALADVDSGNWRGAAGRLGGTWQGLPSGTSKHQGKRSWSQFDAAIDKAYKQNEEQGRVVQPGTPFSDAAFDGMRPKGTTIPLDLTSPKTSSRDPNKFHMTSDDMIVRLVGERGQALAPPQSIPTKFAPIWSTGQ